MVLLFELSILSLLFPLASSFRVIAPTSVTVGKTEQVQWIRQNGDSSSFSLLLRRDSQDHGGTLIQTIKSTGDSQGTVEFTVKEQTNYLIEIISDLQPLQDNQQPENILATSSTINAVQGSDTTSQSSSLTTSSTSTPSTRTTTQTTPTPVNTGADSGSNSSNNGGAEKTESTTSNRGGNTAGTVTSTGASSSTSTVAGTAGQAQGSQDTGSSPAGSITPTTPSSNTPTDSNTSPSPTSTGEPPIVGASSKKPNVGAIVGSVLGGLVFLFLIFSLLFLYNRRKRRQHTLEYAFRRDLMIRPDRGDHSISFHSVSPSEFNTPGPSNHVPKMSELSNGGFTTYQKYWENQPTPDTSKNQNQDQNAGPLIHGSNPSTSTYTSSSAPTVFYTAVPKPSQPPQPELAPGFTFPTRSVSTPDAPTPTTTTSTRTDRQIAIQNKMNQLRTQMIVLQSRNARGSGFTDDSKSTNEEGGNEREEIGKIREELERLTEIMNSGWAMRRTESGGDVPAGLKV